MYQCGTRIEDVIHKGQIKGKPKRVFGVGNSGPSGGRISGTTQAMVGVVQQVEKKPRVFHDLGVPLSKAFANLSKRGYLQALELKPFLSPIPSN